MRRFTDDTPDFCTQMITGQCSCSRCLERISDEFDKRLAEELAAKKSESGFSLVELAIASAFMLVLFGLIGTIYLGTVKTVNDVGESSKMNEDAEFSISGLRSDLEKTGRNLTVQNDQTFAGTMNVPFARHSDYEVEGGDIRRVDETSSEPLTSLLRFRGNSEFSFSGTTFSLTFQDYESSAATSWGIRRQTRRGQENIEILQNGRPVQQISGRASLSAVPIKVIFSASGANGDYQCLVTFWRETQILHQLSSRCSTDFKQILFEMPSGNSVTRLELSASEIILGETNDSAVRFPLLPLYQGMRMTSPITATDNGFLILSGDVRKDVMNLTQPVAIQSATADQTIYVNDASAIKAGDVLFMMDFVNQRSVLLLVNELGSVAPALVVTPIENGDTAGFNNLYSERRDFDGYTFQNGTRVVKLAAPVEYGIGSNSSETVFLAGLYRRVAFRDWEMVLPSARHFSLISDVQPNNISYEVSFEVGNEGIEDVQRTEKVRFSISPRALNKIYDVR